MKKLFGIMLTMTMLLFAGTVYADHAPPNQTAEQFSILQNEAPAIASIEAIEFEQAPITVVSFSESIRQVYLPVENEIAVDSGQGYKRFGYATNTYSGYISNQKCGAKYGGNRIRQLC